MRRITILSICLLFFFSCLDGKKVNYKPASIGAINTLAVIMDTRLWEGSVGDKIREKFAAPSLGLTWDEPIFSIDHMPKSVFTGPTRHRRSVLFVSLDSLDIAQIQTDTYATPQRIGVIKGQTEEQLIENIEAGADRLIASYKKLELEETQKRFLRSLNKEKALEEEFGIRLRVPSIYTVGKQESNFIWIDRQIPRGTMNILAYTIPGGSLTNDSTLVSDIIKMRDSIGMKYIPGPDIPNKTTYMMTEKAFAPYVFITKVKEKKAIEVRGIWEVKNYPMAGPFQTYIIDDPERDRKLVIEGFTFAPATNKRDYMFELEAILKTIEFL